MTVRRVPELDDELRRRLGRRFGSGVEGWLDVLPAVLADLAERWQLELRSIVQRGSVSVVVRCHTADNRPVVLKLSPDRKRIQDEAAALPRWHTAQVPTVLAVDESIGALLIEAIEPGTSLAESTDSVSPDALASLIASLHRNGALEPSLPPLAERVAHLFEAGWKNYLRRPDLAELIPPELYVRGRRLATRLAADAPATVLLHGDLTPANVLDGGHARGLVAIDPAPCVGDPAFDALDLVFWRADDLETITARVQRMAPAIGAETRRLAQWCSAFAAMTALEIAEASKTPDGRMEHLLTLACSGTDAW